jgi:predicted DNA-binding protein with PD1-like motif
MTDNRSERDAERKGPCEEAGGTPGITTATKISLSERYIIPTSHIIGDHMKHAMTTPGYIVRIDQGEEIISSLKRFCTEKGITLGTLQGISAVDRAVIGWYEPGIRKYHTTTLTGDMEITALVGKITMHENAVHLHIHATLSDTGFQARGGHLSEAIVNGTCEVFIMVFDGEIARRRDDQTGLSIMDL